MDASAIQKIIDTAQERSIDVGGIPAVIIDKTSQVTSLEHLLERPMHHRVHFQTALVDEFATYCNTNADPDQKSTVYISPEEMSALAILDHGSDAEPLWGRHRATVAPKKTPEYKALIEANNKLMSQQDFIDFLIDNKAFIALRESEEALEFQDGINRIRKLTVTSLSKAESEIGQFNTTRSALESVEIASGAAKPPTHFIFNSKPYEEMEEYVLLAEIRPVQQGDKIQLRYRLQELDTVTNHIAEYFREMLKKNLTPDIAIYIGSITHR